MRGHRIHVRVSRTGAAVFVIAVTFLLALRPRVAGPRLGTAAQSDSVPAMVSNCIVGNRMFAGSLARSAFLSLALVGCSAAAAGGGASADDAGAIADAGPTVDVGPPPNIDDPVEPVWQPDQVGARVKSPNQRMHFTAGLPFRILADGNDPKAWQCPPGHPPYVCPDSSMVFYIDGAAVGTASPDPANWNLWELRMPNGLSAGDHVITVRFTPHGAPAVDGLVPIHIYVDPVPSHANTVNLASDLVLTGNTDLDWTDAVVKGNGHTVTAAAGYSGKVIIHNSFVSGLAAFDNNLGINVTTTGLVDVSGSIFEATAPLRLVVNGSAPISLRNNEFRSTNYVTYVSSDPNRSPILDLSGTTSGSKIMQGNNIGAGIVLITGMSGWQIGGLRDSQGNILVGPRCVLQLDSSPNAIIQGNYLHHDYYGGFSQGFNLQLSGHSNNALAEHNVIRDSSWPVQSFGGELRYNLMINSGHNFIRSSQSQTRFHHNILAHAQAPNSKYDGALFLYSTEQNIAFDNNTVDVGGAAAKYDAPAIVLGSAGVSLASLRNNVFTQFVDANGSWANKAIVTGSNTESTVGAARVANADYNAWYNPLAPNTGHYMPGIVAGTPGSHDINGDPKFAGAVPQVPYQIDEGLVWLRKYGVSQVLSYYRALYTPRAGSPLVDAGDPADGSGNDIGAVGAGNTNAADKFGLVMEAN
jgi:hypothetical protein